MKMKRLNRTVRFKIAGMLATVMMLVFVIIFLFPLYIALISAFKTKPEIAQNVLALPAKLYWVNFINGIEHSNFIRALMNTCIVTFPSVLLIVLSASMCGYTIARNSRDSFLLRFVNRLFLASLMIPFQTIMIPVYRLYKTLGLQNSLFGMIIMLTGTGIAYSSFLYIGFVKSIPFEIEESALIDGSNSYQTFLFITFPMLKPITATIAALHFMWLWNDFNIALILLQKEEVRTLTIKQFYFFGEYSADYGVAFAVSLLSMIPVIAFFLLMQKYIISGITAGAIKS